MEYSSLIPFNDSVKKIYKQHYIISVFFIVSFILFFIIGKSELSKTQINTLKEKGAQLSSKYSLYYEKDLTKLINILKDQDLNDYLQEEDKSRLSQILSSKIIVDKLFDLLLICNKNGEVISSSRVTTDGKLIPYINILNANISKEKWFKSFILSDNKLSVTHLSQNDPIAKMVFTDKNLKLSLLKFNKSEFILLAYNEESDFNKTIIEDIGKGDDIIIVSTEGTSKRLFKNKNNIDVKSIDMAKDVLRKNRYKFIDLQIPSINISNQEITLDHVISIFYKSKNNTMFFSIIPFTLFISFIIGFSVLLQFLLKRSLDNSKVKLDSFFKNGKIDRSLSSDFADRLLIEPESLEKCKKLSIDLQEGLNNFSTDKPLINTGIALLRSLSNLNSVHIKQWADYVITKQTIYLNEKNVKITDAVVLNQDYEIDGNNLEPLEKVIDLISVSVINGSKVGYFKLPNEKNPIKLELDFSESYNNLKIFYNLSNVKFNNEKLSNSDISLFINEDDPKYIFNKNLLKGEKNSDLDIFENLVIHIHEMRGVLFIKNGVDGLIVQISLPILYTHMLDIDIDEKKDYALIKCTRSWTSRFDTDFFNNRLKMLSTTYNFKNVLLDLNELEEISEIALVRLFYLQNELSKKDGKLIIYKSFGKMESQHFYNLLGVKNRLNILGDIKLAKSAFIEKKEEISSSLKLEKNDLYTKIIIKGKLSTVSSVKEFISSLKESVKTDKNIVIDMSSSSFLNSSVLGVLASESLRFTKNGGKIIMLNPNDYVFESLEVFDLNKIIPIVNKEDELEERFKES